MKHILRVEAYQKAWIEEREKNGNMQWGAILLRNKKSDYTLISLYPDFVDAEKTLKARGFDAFDGYCFSWNWSHKFELRVISETKEKDRGELEVICCPDCGCMYDGSEIELEKT